MNGIQNWSAEMLTLHNRKTWTEACVDVQPCSPRHLLVEAGQGPSPSPLTLSGVVSSFVRVAVRS